MIVTCAQCATNFQLEEARVPENGIRVRCSVCKHAFVVEHPDAFGEVSDPITRAVEDALRSEAGGVPEAAHDLEAVDAVREPGAGRRGPDAPADESWEFSDGGRFSGATSRDAVDRFEESFEAAREAVDDLLGAPEPAPERAIPPWRATGFELPEPGPEPEPLPEPEPGPECEAARVDEEPRISLGDDPWENPGWVRDEMATDELDPGPEPAADAEADGLDVDDGQDSFEADDGLDGELGAFEDDPSAAEPELDLAAPDLARLGGFELEAAADRERFAQEAELPEEAGSGSMAAVARPSLGLGAPLELEPERGGLAWLAGAGDALGAAVVSILAAVAFWAAAAPRATSAPVARSQELAGLEASGIDGRWVEHETLGLLYVVSGELHNPGTVPRAPGARLVVRLLDVEGAPLGVSVASLAPPLGAVWLREGHPGDLHAAREAGARELARTPLAAGERVAFEVVIEDVPEAARRFDLAALPLAEAAPEGS